MKSYRFKNTEDPMSAWGHALFADSMEDNEHYGDILYTVDHSHLTEFSDLRDHLIEEIEESYLGWENPDFTAEELADAFNPQDIVDSAEGYDNADFMDWFCTYILPDSGIKGIKTQDGAVVFDPSIITRIGHKDDLS